MVSGVSRVLDSEPVADLAAYLERGGGQGLETALALPPDDVIEIVRASGLRGRGGAGFPTGVKWRSIVDAAGSGSDVYLVCNAAEGEPGTFKDRLLMGRNPYQLLEGILIGVHALGATRAFIGVKAGFAEQVRRLIAARDDLVEAGWERAADVRVVPGPDEYLFGEESAMLEVIEGKLPLPRILPPYQIGLFATMEQPNPTAVNNVESLSHVALILRHGADWFRRVGTTESPGTMVFTVVGDVDRPGAWELPMGTPLRELVVDLAGASDIKAIYSGTSNAVIVPGLLDLPLDFDSFAEAGTGLGSGGFMVYDHRRSMVQVCAVLARFLAIESCGQCLACKLGTAEMSERLEALVRGEGTPHDIAEIRKRTETVTDLNRCYLPVGAALLIRSTIEEFADEFAASAGSPVPPERAVDVPKITDLDDGRVAFDLDYRRKRSDWSYAPEE